MSLWTEKLRPQLITVGFNVALESVVGVFNKIFGSKPVSVPPPPSIQESVVTSAVEVKEQSSARSKRRPR